ncbi:MAG: matrixin family metalloprotease, partial [Pseudohongiellaceae bacterium]
MNKFFACALLLLFPAAVFSFEVDGNRWPEGETTFHVDFTGLSPSGTSWNQSFEDALAQWNEKTSFNFLISDTYADPCEGYGQNIETGSDFVFPDGEGDSRNGADFYDTVCGNEFGSNVLAITLILSSSGLLGFSHITQTDILYKNAINWDVYRGNTRPAVDFGRVSLHELGHVLGLGHESEQPAIMAPSISNIDSLQNDDINGVNAIYGGPSTDCSIALVTLDTVINGTLGEGDCRVLDLYNGGSDTSFVDGYKLILDDATGLTISMESSDLDSVVLLTEARLHGLEFNDDFNGTCNARISGTFPAG